uniref:Kinase-like protein n=1 Tax=Panagrellus redivivus TaxID=6233 RepID=A0A7E4VHT9_PANRE
MFDQTSENPNIAEQEETQLVVRMLRLSSSTTSTSNMTDDDCASSLADDVILPHETVPETPEVVDVMEATLTTPLKHCLTTVCTIGTGTFGRVELTRHRVTGHYYALKALYIPTIVSKRQVDHVHNEKRVLQRLSHPFIVKLYDTAKDTRNLYMIMEFLAGGELFSYLRMSQALPSGMVKFYAAEITLAFAYLHSLKIAYRDLKPENLLLSHDGHIKLTDFGFAKEIHNKSYTVCGTPEYLAPELIARSGHNQCVDWWALGVLIFELMSGTTPFPGRSASEVRDSMEAVDGVIEFPKKTFSSNAKDIVLRLLKLDPTQRLGNGPNGADDVKRHPWFETCDWDRMLDKAVEPPLTPTIYHEGDTGNFDSYEELEDRPKAPQRELDLFDEW